MSTTTITSPLSAPGSAISLPPWHPQSELYHGLVGSAAPQTQEPVAHGLWMSDDLVKRLREQVPYRHPGTILLEAADLIEQQAARIAELERERAEDAQLLLHCRRCIALVDGPVDDLIRRIDAAIAATEGKA